MSNIFVSYRRSGASTTTYRLVDELQRLFGDNKVFLDVESIDPGLPFAEAILKSLKNTSVVLVVMGPRWLSMTSVEGDRRLDDPNDWVRQEVKLALASKVRVIPVLVEGAEMPEDHELPEDIRGLAALQAFPISNSQAHWSFDTTRLAEKIHRIDPDLQLRQSTTNNLPPVAEASYSYKVISAWIIWVLVGLTAITTGWADEEELLGALVFLLFGLGLCIFALSDIKKGKVKGRIGAWSAGILCGLAFLGNLGGFYTNEFVGDALDVQDYEPAAVIPQSPLSSPSVAHIGGVWFGPDGARYQIQQSDNNAVSFIEYNAFGLQVGHGSGNVVGSTLRFQYYNSLLNMGAQGVGNITDDIININLVESSSGQRSSLAIFRE